MKKKNILIVGGLIILIILFTIGLYFYSINSASKSCEEVTVVIEKGDGTSKIINNLSKNKLIKSEIATKIYVKLNNIMILPGTYKISKCYNTKTIFEIFSLGKVSNVSITFYEGKRVSDFVSEISDNLNIKEEDIYKVLNDKEYLKELIAKYDFLTDKILNSDIYNPLEGYLFPDTYFFNENASIKEIIEKMLDNSKKILDNYNTSIKESDYDIHEILTVASIIENETMHDEDRSIVSGIIYKRLDKKMPLGMDVTTYYGVQKSFKEKLTSEDLNAENGYNTRLAGFIGLPVGPICNPSEKSIKAALNPSNTDYLYFYADSVTGKLYYSKTYEEHQRIANSF